MFKMKSINKILIILILYINFLEKILIVKLIRKINNSQKLPLKMLKNQKKKMEKLIKNKINNRIKIFRKLK